jgi:hypothetical protein
LVAILDRKYSVKSRAMQVSQAGLRLGNPQDGS